MLDKLQVERERGITVKAQTASLFYSRHGQEYLLNLIDTPVRTRPLRFSQLHWSTNTHFPGRFPSGLRCILYCRFLFLDVKDDWKRPTCSLRALINPKRRCLSRFWNIFFIQGHVDFSYEVSRSISACQGVLLIVDANQVRTQILFKPDILKYSGFRLRMLLICWERSVDFSEGNPSADSGQLLPGFWSSAGNHPRH